MDSEAIFRAESSIITQHHADPCAGLPRGLRRPPLEWLDERQLERATIPTYESDFFLVCD